VRVDVTALNHDGALVDCASIAALASLAHSRRPDVTLSGEEVTIHSLAERDPLSLTLHHNPICVSYAIFDKGYVLTIYGNLRRTVAVSVHLILGMFVCASSFVLKVLYFLQQQSCGRSNSS